MRGRAVCQLYGKRMGWASHLGIAATLLPGFAPSLPAQDFLFRLFDTPGRMDTQRIGYEAPPPAGQGGVGYKDVSSGRDSFDSTRSRPRPSRSHRAGGRPRPSGRGVTLGAAHYLPNKLLKQVPFHSPPPPRPPTLTLTSGGSGVSEEYSGIEVPSNFVNTLKVW